MDTEERKLSLPELGSIDQVRMKAYTILDEARNLSNRYNFDLAVRRAQEAFELYTKAIFLFVGKGYPKTHDLEKQIYEVATSLSGYNITSEEVATMVLANSTLSLWRDPSFYGDEKLKVGKLFGRREAELATSYAERVQLICEKVRTSLYRRASRS